MRMRVLTKKLRVEIENEMRVFLESLNIEIEMRVSQKSVKVTRIIEQLELEDEKIMNQDTYLTWMLCHGIALPSSGKY